MASLVPCICPCLNTLSGRLHGQLAAGGEALFIDCVYSPAHTGSQKRGHPTDQAPAWLLPTNLALGEHWSRALPPCPGHHNLPAAETLLPGLSYLWFPAWASQARWDPWMKLSVGHACEFKFSITGPSANPSKLLYCFWCLHSPLWSLKLFRVWYDFDTSLPFNVCCMAVCSRIMGQGVKPT